MNKINRLYNVIIKKIIISRHVLLFSSIFFTQKLFAEDRQAPSLSFPYNEGIEVTVPSSFYEESWNPEEEPPLIFPQGICIEEKDRIDLEAVIKSSRQKQDILRRKNNWPGQIVEQDTYEK